MAKSVHTLSIPSSTRYLERVRRFVETHVRTASLADEAIEQFKIAVDEACTNVIKHAYRGDDSQQIDVAVIVEDDRVTVRIRDAGRSFQQEFYTRPDIFELAEHRRAGGFGVHIMRSLMDRVEYSSRGNTNEVRLTKFRNGTDGG